MIFDALVVAYARGNALRALVSILAIAFGVGTALLLSLAGSFSRSALGADRMLYSHHLDFVIAPYTGEVPQSLLARVRDIDGIASAEPIIDRNAVVATTPAALSRGLTLRLLGVDLLDPLPGVTGFEEALPGPFAPAGAFIDPEDVLGTNGAILTAALARRFHLHRGNGFTLLAGAATVRMHVANVLPPSAHGVDPDTAFVDIETAQRLFASAQSFDRIEIVASAPAGAVAPHLLAALHGRARLIDPQADAASLSDLTAGLDATFGTIAAIALAIGGLLVWSAVGTSIAQRRGDIGTLRALGVAPLQIALAFATEGAAYGAIGATLGIGLALGALHELAQFAHTATPGLASDPWPFARTFGLGVSIATLASILPALAAARVAPALAARQGSFERAQSKLRIRLFALAGTVCFTLAAWLALHPRAGLLFALGLPLTIALGGSLAIPGFLARLGGLLRTLATGAPVPLRLAASLFEATPQRVSIALAALAIAVYAAVAFDITSTSFQRALGTWAERALAGDLVVRPVTAGDSNDAVLDARSLARVQATPGVAGVSAARTLHLQSRGIDVSVRGEDAQAAPRPAGSPVPADLGAQLAATLHVRSGDVFDVNDARRTLRLRVASVLPDFTAGRGTIVVARSALARAFADERIDALTVRLLAGRDPAVVRDLLERRLQPLGVTISTMRDVRAHLEGDFETTFSVVRILGSFVVAIALFGIVSALAALVTERRFELRTLRRLGASRGTIARMLVFESSLIALCAATLGVMLAFALATAILDGADRITLGFAIPMSVPFGSVAATLLVTVAAATLGAIVSLPAAARIATDANAAQTP